MEWISGSGSSSRSIQTGRLPEPPLRTLDRANDDDGNCDDNINNLFCRRTRHMAPPTTCRRRVKCPVRDVADSARTSVSSSEQVALVVGICIIIAKIEQIRVNRTLLTGKENCNQNQPVVSFAASQAIPLVRELDSTPNERKRERGRVVFTRSNRILWLTCRARCISQSLLATITASLSFYCL